MKYSKIVPWFSQMHKEGNEHFYLYNKIWLLPRTWIRALGLYFYSSRNQTTSYQYKLSKKTSAAHYSGTIGLSVLESK